jgi:hypothetical protein
MEFPVQPGDRRSSRECAAGDVMCRRGVMRRGAGRGHLAGGGPAVPRGVD